MNIIITAQGTATNRIIINGTKKVKFNFDCVAGPEIKGNTRINALNICDKTLKQLSESEHIKSESSEPSVIYNCKMLSSAIENGFPLYWLNNGGKTLSGDTISETELNLWKEFYSEYAKNITKVIFKDSSDFVASRKNSKFPPRAADSEIISAIDESWKIVKSQQQQFEESYGEGL